MSSVRQAADAATVDALVARLVSEISEWPEVAAVVQGGSRATGIADSESDVDLYVYVDSEIPVARRAALIHAQSDDAEIDNRVWETGDEWHDRATGVAVDVMYRSPAWIEDELSRVLDRAQASLGYSTCLWHNVRTAKPLFDRDGWFARVQAKAAQPYPEELARAIVRKNLRLLRGAHAAFPRQILRAARRGDLVSINHRTTALLASYFDVLFALNRAPHPGEKRLVLQAKALAVAPQNLAVDVAELLRAGAACDEATLPVVLARLVDGLEELLGVARLSECGG